MIYDPIYFDHVHRLFDTLDPHTAENVRPHIDNDAWATTLSDEQRDELERDVRSFDPENLGSVILRAVEEGTPMTTLPSNVYVVLAMSFPVVFIDENDAIDFANLSGNEPVRTCALRTREDAAELLSEFESPEDERETALPVQWGQPPLRPGYRWPTQAERNEVP